jgi:hypothetical protein
MGTPFPRSEMVWQDILLVLIRCEFDARYHRMTGWQLSAKGALPVVLVLVGAIVAWMHGHG